MSKSPSRKSIISNFGAMSMSPRAEADSEGAASSDAKPAAPPATRVGAGIIGATQRTLTEIREERDRLQALVDAGGGGATGLDPMLIDPSPFPDRIPDDSDLEFTTLKQVIEQEGQKLPIQVRPHPKTSGRFQIIYGHRRWRAARELGRPVMALVVDMSDRDLVVAQGIENGNRQDLSWIEKALFAARMEEAGVKARDIRSALSIDDPELAKMRSVWRALPKDLIEAIGRAPKVGRPRWIELAGLLDDRGGALETIRKTLSADKVLTLPSDERFRRVMTSLKAQKPSVRNELKLLASNGQVIGRAAFTGKDVRLIIEKGHAVAFADFLRDELPALTEKFNAREGGKDNAGESQKLVR